MKAVFISEPGGRLEVRETAIPEPGPGEVLVRMLAAPVNPSDLSRIREAHLYNDLITFIPGLEGSGVVVASGKGILPAMWKGKRVACSATRPESGTWSEYMVTGAGSCFPLRKTVSDEQGSMSIVNPLTALAFIETAKKGKHRAIINNAAAGSLGRMLEFLCRRENITLINIVRSRSNMELLVQNGSCCVLNSSEPAFYSELKKLSEALKATLMFYSAGGENFSSIIESIPHGSSVVIYGSLSDDEYVQINPRKLLANDIKISGFYLGSYAKRNGMIRNIINLRKTGILMSRGMTVLIRERYPLENVQEAVDSYLENMTAGKVILQPWS